MTHGKTPHKNMLYNIYFLNNKTPFIQGYFAQEIKTKLVKFIYSEKATKFCEIFT